LHREQIGAIEFLIISSLAFGPSRSAELTVEASVEPRAG